jgi:hypothetical protein
MGWKYEVNWWMKTQDWTDYQYVAKYRGEWLFMALLKVIEGRIRGIGCIQLEIR